MRVLTKKIVDDISNVTRKPGGKNADGMPDREQQVLVIAQENPKFAVFLFNHWCRCMFNWEVMGVKEDTVHLLAGQKRLKDECTDPDVLPKVNKADMMGMMESIKEYLRSCHGVVTSPLAYVIRKTITDHVGGDYPKNVTPDDKMITRMLHPPQDKKKLHNEQVHIQQVMCTVSHRMYSRVQDR